MYWPSMYARCISEGFELAGRVVDTYTTTVQAIQDDHPAL